MTITSDNFQEIHDRIVYDAQSEPTQRNIDKRQAFLALFVHSGSVVGAMPLTQPGFITAQTLQDHHVVDLARQLEILAEARVVRTWVEAHPKAKIEVDKSRQMQLGEKSVTEVLETLNTNYPVDQDERLAYKQQLERYYRDAVGGVALDRTDEFRDALIACLTDAQVPSFAAKRLANEIVDQNALEKEPFKSELGTFHVLPEKSEHQGMVVKDNPLQVEIPFSNR